MDVEAHIWFRDFKEKRVTFFFFFSILLPWFLAWFADSFLFFFHILRRSGGGYCHGKEHPARFYPPHWRVSEMDDQAGELICGYGDIRTSLTFVDAPGVANAEDFLIALSPIIWPLTNVVTIKYVTIVLFANGD